MHRVRKQYNGGFAETTSREEMRINTNNNCWLMTDLSKPGNKGFERPKGKNQAAGR